jgi:hypothetical protein
MYVQSHRLVFRRYSVRISTDTQAVRTDFFLGGVTLGPLGQMPEMCPE